MQNKSFHVLSFITLMVLSSCTIPSSLASSLVSEYENSTDISSSSEMFSTESISSQTTSETSTSSSITPIPRRLTITRDIWTSLSTYPTSETSVSFSDVQFRYLGAGNYTAGVIQGRRNEFYLYNQSSLLVLNQIVITLTSAKSHFIYAGFDQKPTGISITPSISNDQTIYTYDFVGSAYSHFQLVNGDAAIYIQSVVIDYTIDGQVPSSSSSSSTSSSSSSSSTPASNELNYTYVTPNYDGPYYNTIDSNLFGQALLLALDDLLDADSASGFSYSGMASVFVKTDNDPTRSGNLISFYSGNSASFPGNFSGNFNREHTWPNSRGGGAIENDPHVIRPTLVNENSARGNSFFNVGPTAWDPASFNNSKYRGIAARVIMYGAVKGQESGLKLVDLTTDGTGNKSMGKLATLLEWNLTYAIDATEIQRNEALVSHWGHNRNPFIDDRNYACRIWGNETNATRLACGISS
jgi:endonuclease I